MRSLLPGSGVSERSPEEIFTPFVATTVEKPDGHDRSLDLSAAGGFSRVLGMFSRSEVQVLYPT